MKVTFHLFISSRIIILFVVLVCLLLLEQEEATTTAAAGFGKRTSRTVAKPLATSLNYFDSRGAGERNHIVVVVSDDDVTSTLAAALSLRGGGAEKKATPTTGKRRRTNRSSKRSRKTKTQEIHKVLKKDTAESMGDAIRDRAQDLLREDEEITVASEHSLPAIMNQRMLESIGWAMGASDFRSNSTTTINTNGVDAGVEVATTSVLAHYFLKSHGGAHAIQCLLSVCAAMAGAGALVFRTNLVLQRTLTKRCLMFAMLKHVSGLLAGAIVAARAVPEVGLPTTRAWLEQLVADPISQYVFYTACLLLWLPAMSTNGATSIFWWEKFTALLLGPVLLRETVSSALVLSDILVLWSCSGIEDDDGWLKNLVQSAFELFHKVLDAWMSIVVTPKVWRPASPAQRQAILSKLTSKLSLAMEVAVGAVLLADACFSSATFIFGTSGHRPPFFSLLKRLICTRLFIQFLWNRRSKIDRLVTDVRGGAAHIPMYILDVLIDPAASMGIRQETLGSSMN